MYKSSDLGGVNDIWDFRFNIKKSLPPRNHWIYTWEKKTLYKLNLVPKIRFYMVLMDIGKYRKPCIRASQDKKNDVHKLTNSSHSERWGRKPCTQTKEFRPQWALGTKTMYDSRANHGIPRMGGKNPVSWCQKFGRMIYANKKVVLNFMIKIDCWISRWSMN